jgi:hypothetical protein
LIFSEEKLKALLQESLLVATRTEAIKPADLNRIIVDTTMQPKNVMFPTDAKLLNRAREILVRLAKNLKSEHRMGRNYLWHRDGDATNAVVGRRRLQRPEIDHHAGTRQQSSGISVLYGRRILANTTRCLA